ncbi:MAG: hypothetical protein K2I62_07825 [Alistipes sp.]|nr:hypothetical protein [Alistipes sp.]MDE7344967.1 hypothetical protein [Alistipes sp.]
MKTLITPQQAMRLAFGADEPLPPGIIGEADIAAAEARWIVPALGRRLHAKLLTGAHLEFRNEYLAAPLALYTRALIQPRLDVRTDRNGTTKPAPADAQPADAAARCELRRQLLRQGRTLLLRATDYLDEYAALYPEYEPGTGPAARCSLESGIVLPARTR